MADIPDQPESFIQRTQRLQAERLNALAASGPIVPKPSSDVPASPLGPVAPPSHERPDPALVRKLNHDRLVAHDGNGIKVAAALLVTLCQPLIEKLWSESKSMEHPYKAELEFWASCLSAGVFPHAPAKPDRELSGFETWFYDSIPSVDSEGVINNWRTL